MDLKALSDKVETVLREIMPEVDGYEEGDILFDWILVGYVDNPESDKGAAYPILVSTGDMPTFKMRGLLTTGLYHLNQGNLHSDEEDSEGN